MKNGLFEPKRSHFAPPGFPSLFIWGSYGYFAIFGILKQFYAGAANKKFSMAPEHACLVSQLAQLVASGENVPQNFKKISEK